MKLEINCKKHIELLIQKILGLDEKRLQLEQRFSKLTGETRCISK